jgi:hypothetical protein
MKRALLAATAILSTSFATVPAYAGPNDDIPLNGVNDTSGLTPQQVCEAILRPNDPNSQFHTAPTDVTENVVLTSTLVTDATSYQQVPTGTPTYSNYGNFDNTYHRNGSSPNVWTGADANTATYPSSDLYYHQHYHNVLGSTFGCEVWKDPGGTEHGPDAIYPPGLQSSGSSTVTGTADVPTDDYINHGGPSVTTGGDFHDTNVLICISPNKLTNGKPGTWTNKNGFTGSCSAANTAAGGTVISGNAPS